MIETMIRAFFAMLEFHSVDVVILIRHDVYRISRDDANVDAQISKQNGWNFLCYLREM